MIEEEMAPAVPLWVDGHALLTMPPAFLDVRDARSGAVLRRTPLCGADATQRVLASATVAVHAWNVAGEPGRRQSMADLAEALEECAGHFAALLAEETGVSDAVAQGEVAAAWAALRDPAADDGPVSVRVVAASLRHPFADAVRMAAAAWRSGSVVVLRPPPEAPSALFALAELSTAAGWPPGVCNVVQGDDALLEALRRDPSCRLILAGGEP